MEGFDDAPKPVRVLASFFDEYAEAHEDQPLDLTQLQIMRKNIDQTFNEDFRRLKFDELRQVIATFKNEKRLVFVTLRTFLLLYFVSSLHDNIVKEQ